MSKKDEALKLAEDALKRVRTQDMELVQLSMIALAAIREALTSVPDWASEAIEQPAQQEPLTDEQYFEIGQRHWLPSIKVEKIHKEIIEAAHGITKGGGV